MRGVATSSTTTHECKACGSGDAGTVVERHDVLGVSVIGTRVYCNPCGAGSLHIKVGDHQPQLIETWESHEDPEEESKLEVITQMVSDQFGQPDPSVWR